MPGMCELETRAIVGASYKLSKPIIDLGDASMKLVLGHTHRLKCHWHFGRWFTPNNGGKTSLGVCRPLLSLVGLQLFLDIPF
jgi:hypothetical protein